MSIRKAKNKDLAHDPGACTGHLQSGGKTRPIHIWRTQSVGVSAYGTEHSLGLMVGVALAREQFRSRPRPRPSIRASIAPAKRRGAGVHVMRQPVRHRATARLRVRYCAIVPACYCGPSPWARIRPRWNGHRPPSGHAACSEPHRQ
jgi:hypothetical protein